MKVKMEGLSNSWSSEKEALWEPALEGGFRGWPVVEGDAGMWMTCHWTFVAVSLFRVKLRVLDDPRGTVSKSSSSGNTLSLG